jgi:hypothetical protein
MAAKAIWTVSKVAAGVALVLAGNIVAGKTKPAPDPSRRVCKSLMPAGSHIRKRYCLTQAEWDESARRAQDSLFKQQVDGMIKPVPSANSPGVDFPKPNN